MADRSMLGLIFDAIYRTRRQNKFTRLADIDMNVSDDEFVHSCRMQCHISNTLFSNKQIERFAQIISPGSDWGLEKGEWTCSLFDKSFISILTMAYADKKAYEALAPLRETMLKIYSKRN